MNMIKTLVLVKGFFFFFLFLAEDLDEVYLGKMTHHISCIITRWKIKHKPSD